MNKSKLLFPILIAVLVMQTILQPVYASRKTADYCGLSRLAAFEITDSSRDYDIDSPITRGEFTAMIIKAGNAKPTSVSHFTDVSSEYDYSGYINTAYEMGVVSGYGNGTFNPNGTVSAGEAAKMSLVLLGYGSIIDSDAGMEKYMSEALKIKLFNGVSDSGKKVLTKGDAAKIINNLLDTNRYVETLSDGNYSINTTVKTAIEYFFGVEKIYAETLEVYKKQGRVQIKNLSTNTVENYALSGRISADSVFGTHYYYIDTRYNTVVYIDIDADGIIYDYICGVNKNFDGGYFDIKSVDKITLTNSGEYRVSDDADIFVDDVQMLGGNIPMINCFAVAYTDGGVIEKLCIYNMTEGGLLYRADNDILKYSDRYWDDNVLSGFSDVDDLNVIIDGNPYRKMTDLKPDMVFDYYKSDERVLVVASSRMAEGILKSGSQNTISVGDEKLSLSDSYGAMVYSKYYQRYFDYSKNSDSVGKYVYAFIDDNCEVRYIRARSETDDENEFVGLVAGSYESGFKRSLSVWKVSNDAVPAVVNVSEKLSKSSVSFEHAASTAKAYDGSNFFRFKTDSDGNIICIENVDYFGNVSSVSSYGFSESTTSIGNIYCGDAVVFAVFDDPIYGDYTVKTLSLTSFSGCMTDNSSGMKIISDFNNTYNPTPNYVMLSDGYSQVRHQVTQIDVIADLTYETDSSGNDIANVKIASGTTYRIMKDYADSKGLSQGMIIKYTTHHVGKNPIHIVSAIDISGDTSGWPCKQYTLNPGEGLYKADSVVFRNGVNIQFMIDGEPSNVHELFNNWDDTTVKVVQHKGKEFIAPGRYLTGYTSTRKSKSYMMSMMTAIQRNDNVWFYLNSSGVVTLIIFESNNTVN